MDIHILLNELLENCDWTTKKIVYVANIIKVSEDLKKYPEIENITISDLEYTHFSHVRLIAKCFNVLNIHGFTKQTLIEMIRNKYNELTVFCDDKSTPNDTDIPVLLSQPIRSMHETKIQSPLEIGAPVPYDSDEYFDLSIITEMYHQYPVQYINDKRTDRVVLSFKTMLDFMKHATINLYKKHYRCFKYVHGTWYAFTSDNIWTKTDIDTIDTFCVIVFDRIESISSKLKYDEISNAFRDVNSDIRLRNAIFDTTSMKLQKIIKNCS